MDRSIWKMQKTVLRGEGRRTSQRIQAIVACKENQQEKKPVQYAGTRSKRTNDGAQDLTSSSKLNKQVWKGRDNTQDDDHSIKNVEWRSINIPEIMKENQKCDDQVIKNGKPSIMPSKHVLELILDTLQRRDDYEMFAEPVKLDEVEHYSEIIKEPMDFGTMRAKLHEGLYQNLEQFEHDVFLIPENAMYFNSSGTDYYEEARDIHELAQKVFDSLKTDPENIVAQLSELSVPRRRSTRKASKVALHSQPGSSKLRRASKKSLGCSGMTDNFGPRNSSTGYRDGGLSNFELTGRRSTYCAAGSSFSSKANHVDSSLYSSSQPLVLKNQGDISYEDSLMLFVKGLGPIAQMVAKRKLSWMHEPNSTTTQYETNFVSPNPQTNRDYEDSVITTSYQTLSDFAWCKPPVSKISNTIDLNKDEEGESSSRHGRIEFGTPARKNNDFGLPMKEIPDFSTPAKEKTNFVALGKQKLEFSAMTAQEKTDNFARGKEKLDQETVIRTRKKSSESRKGSRKIKHNIPVILALENPNCSKDRGYKPRKRKNFAQMPCNMTSKTKAAEIEGGSSLPQGNLPLQASKPVVSHYPYTLPFFNSRLSMMSAKESEGSSTHAGGSGDYQLKRPLFDHGGSDRSVNCSLDINKPYVFGQSLPRQPFDSLETNLALRL